MPVRRWWNPHAAEAGRRYCSIHDHRGGHMTAEAGTGEWAASGLEEGRAEGLTQYFELKSIAA